MQSTHWISCLPKIPMQLKYPTYSQSSTYDQLFHGDLKLWWLGKGALQFHKVLPTIIKWHTAPPAVMWLWSGCLANCSHLWQVAQCLWSCDLQSSLASLENQWGSRQGRLQAAASCQRISPPFHAGMGGDPLLGCKNNTWLFPDPRFISAAHYHSRGGETPEEGWRNKAWILKIWTLFLRSTTGVPFHKLICWAWIFKFQDLLGTERRGNPVVGRRNEVWT